MRQSGTAGQGGVLKALGCPQDGEADVDLREGAGATGTDAGRETAEEAGDLPLQTVDSAKERKPDGIGRRFAPNMGAVKDSRRERALRLVDFIVRDIASEIAKAHHGAIEARSDDEETAFAVRLPRRGRKA